MRQRQNFHLGTNHAEFTPASDVSHLLSRSTSFAPAPDVIFTRATPVYEHKLDHFTRLSENGTLNDLVEIKNIVQARRKRAQHFGEIFADPAWDILLSLARAEIEQKRVTVSELGLAAVVPMTTALRWIKTLTANGAVERRPDIHDRRRVYIELSAQASKTMKSYLCDIKSHQCHERRRSPEP